MRRTLLPLVLLLAACGRSAPPAPRAAPLPAHGGWVEIGRADGMTIAFDTASVRPVEANVFELLARYDYDADQRFQDVTYRRHLMRVRVRCGSPPVMVTAVSDTLAMGGVVVRGSTFGSEFWGSANETDPPVKRWPVEVCRRVAPARVP